MGIILMSVPISIRQLREAGEELFGDMVKAVVDVEKEIMVVGAELHADPCFSKMVRNRRISGASTYIQIANRQK